jgi:dCMP deaminase
MGMPEAMGWREWVFAMAGTTARKSKDKSTQVGCVIVGPGREIRSLGYNGFPRGVNDNAPERHERPLKYMIVVHAEANAIANAARSGVSLEGCSLYCTHPPCSRCAALIINAGISHVHFRDVPRDTPLDDRWREEFDLAMTLFAEAAVQVHSIRP